jgi:superfamily II DNA or RNA helicase
MNRLKSYESIVSEKGLKPIPYQKEFLVKNEEFNIPFVLGAGTSSGKTFTTAIWIEMFYKDPKNKGKRTLLIPASTTVLRDNMGDSFGFFNPKFTYCVCENGEQLKEAIKGNCDVIICLPQTVIRSLSHLKHFHNFILDEAHQWYFKNTISEIIKKIKPKNQLLLTGTPSKFIAKGDKFNFFFVPVMELYRLGLVSNVKIEVVSSTYNPSQSDYNGSYGNLGDSFELKDSDTSKSLKMVCEDMIKRLKNPSIVKSKHLMNRLLSNPLSIFGEIDKTIIFCHSQKQANQFNKVLNNIDELKGKVLISHTDIDPNSIMFSEFKSNDTKKVLIAVDRGKLGFSMGELFNIVDFTLTQNLDMLLQMYGRLLRLSEKNPDKQKIYYKVATKNTAGYFVDLMTAMLCLTDMEYYSQYNGKNMGGIRIPKVLVNKTKNKLSVTKGTKSKSVKPYVSITELGIPFDLCFFKNVSLYKQTDKFGTVAECTLDDVRCELFDTYLRPKHWSYDKVKSAIDSISYKDEIKNIPGLSQAIIRYNLDTYANTKLVNTKIKWTEKTLKEEFKKYSSRDDVTKNSRGAQGAAKKLGIYDDLCNEMGWLERKNPTENKEWVKKTCKKIKCYDFETMKYIKTYNSIREAERDLNLTDIKRVLSGEYKRRKTYYFKYA